ncbi:MAG: hypothetical protein ACLVJ6_02720 [Merdibacter sp.]
MRRILDYPKVTKSTLELGLGFDYSGSGLMNDTLKYYGRDPIYRKYHHNELTFSMAYYSRTLHPAVKLMTRSCMASMIVDKMGSTIKIRAKNLYLYNSPIRARS